MFSTQNLITYPVGEFRAQASTMTYYLGLIPSFVIEKGYIWQIFTYMFLHGTSSFTHLFFNMYALLIFGAPLEQTWGSKRFLVYYLYCGVGAGITILIINLFAKGLGFYIPTIGASGAVFGLLLAFGMMFPNARILIFFVLPIKAKYLVILYGLLELYLELSGGQGNVSHIGHLGGLLFGLIFFLIQKKRALLYKSKLFIAKREKNKRNSGLTKSKRDTIENNNDIKKNILKKIKSSGFDSLSDDQIQYIKLLDIMEDDDISLCNEEDLNINDDYCLNCENIDRCFMREVRKYL